MVDPLFLLELAASLDSAIDEHGSVILGPTDAKACAVALRRQAGLSRGAPRRALVEHRAPPALV